MINVIIILILSQCDDIFKGKKQFAPLIYPRSGNIPPNVPKFRHDPPEIANAWQKIQSVHSLVCLDGSRSHATHMTI